MPTPSRPQIFQPHSRAEAAAPLTAVEECCKADAEYLAAVAEIVGRVLREALKATEPAPPGETAAARAMRLGKSRFEQMQKRMFEQVANRGAA